MGLVKCRCGKSSMNFKNLSENKMPGGYEGDCCIQADAKPLEKEPEKAPESPKEIEEAPTQEAPKEVEAPKEEEPKPEEIVIPEDTKLEEVDELPEGSEVTENVVMEADKAPETNDKTPDEAPKRRGRPPAKKKEEKA